MQAQTEHHISLPEDKKGSPVMTQEKINTLTGSPRGRGKGFEFAGVSTCNFFQASSLRELLTAPPAPSVGPHEGLAHIPVILGKLGQKECGGASKSWRAEEEQVTTGAAD